MNWNTVDVERWGAVAVVAMARPECLNAFNRELTEELTEVALSFHRDRDIHAVILTGRGRAFSSGFDLKQPPATGRFVERREAAHIGRHLCRAWEEMPQTTIAAVEGPAIGGGVAIAIACDWRVMAQDAYLHVPEVGIGVTLQWQAIPRLVTLVGPARAKRIVMLCEKMPAAQALDWGLADEIAPSGGAVDTAMTLARAACANPPVIMAMTKQTINATANADLHASSFMDADVSMLVSDMEDAVAARERFRAKGRAGAPD